jgi:hypothetical protein
MVWGQPHTPWPGDMKMKTSGVKYLFCLVALLLFSSTGWSKNILNTDSNYSLKIAVVVNNDDNIIGKIEYSNSTLQLVTFNRMGDTIYSEAYLFEILEKTLISKNVHGIKCRSAKDQYGSSLIIGTMDFRDETKPVIHLVNENGNTYISNISEKGKKMHQKYISNIWLVQ